MQKPARDLEKGLGRDQGSNEKNTGFLTRIRRWSSWDSEVGEPNADVTPKRIEDYPAGYPRFSALISSHKSFTICRQFLTMRARLLLLKQDNLVRQEERLEELDRDEQRRLWLGSCRMDGNKERLSLLEQFDRDLADYDSFLERQRNIMQMQCVPEQPLQSLKNWLDGNGCVAREETAYLEEQKDLRSMVLPEDGAMAWLEDLLQRICITYRHIFGNRTRKRDSFSRDPKVHIFSTETVRQVARVLLAPLVTALLLAPVIICNFVGSLGTRLTIVVLSTSLFVAILAGLTRAKTVELIAAGAT